MARGTSNGSVRRLALLMLLALPYGCAEVLRSPGADPPRQNAKAAENGPISHSPTTAAAAVEVGTATATSVVNPPPPPPKSPYAYADTDPADDLVPGPPDPRPDCQGDLKAAGIRYHSAALAVHTEGKKSKITCGAREVVLYMGSPEKISYSSPPLLTCTMALALARFETVIQQEAVKDFGKRVKKIDHLGTYACREMANYPGWTSEHSYANAIDLAVFTLEDGRVISVLKDFQKTETDPTTKKALFLRTISHRAYDDDLFSNVLTEYFDRLHKNHFHLDLSRYRTDGTRPMTE